MFPGETVLSGCSSATPDDFEVMKSNAGYYIGTTTEDGAPNTRETEYFDSYDAAQEALFVYGITGNLLKQRT